MKSEIVVLGGGVVGQNAAEIAIGMGAEVTVVARSAETRHSLSQLFRERICIAGASQATIEALCTSADVVIAAALVAGATAPKLLFSRTVAAMKPGAVIVDVSIDQGGGCAETSRPTTHAQPAFKVHNVVHYCVANMPGAVPRTSTFALNNATRPFILALANKGFPRALEEDAHLRNGLNVHDGKMTCRAVADALGLAFTPAEQVLATA